MGEPANCISCLRVVKYRHNQTVSIGSGCTVWDACLLHTSQLLAGANNNVTIRMLRTSGAAGALLSSGGVWKRNLISVSKRHPDLRGLNQLNSVGDVQLRNERFGKQLVVWSPSASSASSINTELVFLECFRTVQVR